MIEEGYPDNPTGQTPVETPQTVSVEVHHKVLALLEQASQDAKAFIHQCDTEGVGMKTVTDHRKRLEKFKAALLKEGIYYGF